MIFSENHYSITSNESYSTYAFIPTKPIMYKLNGAAGPGTTHRSEACLTSMVVWNGDSATRLALIVFPKASDNIAEIFKARSIMSNAAFGIWEIFLMGLAWGATPELYTQVFGGGSLAIGFMNEARSYAAASFGFQTSARHAASFVSGAYATAEWLGERVHSSGSRADTKVFDETRGISPMNSDLNLAQTVDSEKTGVLCLTDPISRLLATMSGTQTEDYPALSDEMKPGESIVYNFKATVMGRMQTVGPPLEEYLAIYEGEFAIDMNKSGLARLVYENWTQKYADALPAAVPMLQLAWVEPVVGLGIHSNELKIAIGGGGLVSGNAVGGDTYWSVHLIVAKHIVSGSN